MAISITFQIFILFTINFYINVAFYIILKYNLKFEKKLPESYLNLSSCLSNIKVNLSHLCVLLVFIFLIYVTFRAQLSLCRTPGKKSSLETTVVLVHVVRYFGPLVTHYDSVSKI